MLHIPPFEAVYYLSAKRETGGSEEIVASEVKAAAAGQQKLKGKVICSMTL